MQYQDYRYTFQLTKELAYTILVRLVMEYTAVAGASTGKTTKQNLRRFLYEGSFRRHDKTCFIPDKRQTDPMSRPK